MRNILTLPGDECDLRHFTSKCDIFTGCLFIGGYDSLIGVDSPKNGEAGGTLETHPELAC
uniref:Uncharacterized protein n=1 Tax=Aegilops tauschii subsp. strangulata TaxID=200361 RepID=A0A453G2Z0_AEGTS